MLADVGGEDILRSKSLAQSESGANRGVEHGKCEPNPRLSQARSFLGEIKGLALKGKQQIVNLRHK